MAAELALAVNIIEVVKQTYLVARFLYDTVNSAKHENEERNQISAEFRTELLFLASFERYFEKAHGAIAYDQALDEVSRSNHRVAPSTAYCRAPAGRY